MPARLTLENLSVSLADGDRRFTLAVPAMALEAGQIVGLSVSLGIDAVRRIRVLLAHLAQGQAGLVDLAQPAQRHPQLAQVAGIDGRVFPVL